MGVNFKGWIILQSLKFVVLSVEPAAYDCAGSNHFSLFKISPSDFRMSHSIFFTQNSLNLAMVLLCKFEIILSLHLPEP